MYRDGESYSPSNGTEGSSFEEDHCYQCINCNTEPGAKKKCDIWANAIIHWPSGPGYPREWIYKNGKPTCTSFVKW